MKADFVLLSFVLFRFLVCLCLGKHVGMYIGSILDKLLAYIYPVICNEFFYSYCYQAKSGNISN